MPDEVQRLIIQVENEERLRQLTKTLEQQRDIMKQLAAIQVTQRSTPQVMQLQAAASLAIQTQKDITDLQRSTRGMLGAQGTMQLGYAVQDFFAAQGGLAQRFNAVANNLQMVAVSMGITGPWFIGITAAIAAFQLLASNMERLEAAFVGLDPEKVKKSGEHLKEQMAKWAEMQAKPTELQGAAPAAAAKVIEEMGGTEIGKGLAEAFATGAVGPALDESQMMRMAHFTAVENQFPAGSWQRKILDLSGFSTDKEKAKKEIAAQQVGKVMADIGKPGAPGKAAIATLERIAKQFPGAMPGNLQFALQAAQKAAVGKVEYPEDKAAGMEMDWESLKPPEFMGAGLGAPTPARPVVPAGGVPVEGTMPRQAGAPLIQTPQARGRRRRYRQTAPEDIGAYGMTQAASQQNLAGQLGGQMAAGQALQGNLQQAQQIDAMLGHMGGQAQGNEAMAAYLSRIQERLSQLQGGQAYPAIQANW